MKASNVYKSNMRHFSSWQLISPQRISEYIWFMRHRIGPVIGNFSAWKKEKTGLKILKSGLKQRCSITHTHTLKILLLTHSEWGWDTHTSSSWRKHNFKLEWPLSCVLPNRNNGSISNFLTFLMYSPNHWSVHTVLWSLFSCNMSQLVAGLTRYQVVTNTVTKLKLPHKNIQKKS